MAPERRRQILAGALIVLLAGLLVYRLRARPSGAAPSTSNVAASPGRAAARPAPAPDVHLSRLEAERPKLTDARRDLFRFKPKSVPPPPTTGARPAPVPAVPAGPPPVPPPPPIRLKFIGIVEASESARKIAVLSDGTHVYQGREGDIIEGQYRILKIGAESLEMAYLDGRGRQTIRLTGS